MPAVTSSPNSYGGQAFGQISEFGQKLEEIGAKLQAQRDETDLVSKVADYKVRLAQLPIEIINDPNIAPEDRVANFKAKADEFREKLNEGANDTVQRTLSNHAVGLTAEGLIHMQSADVAEQIQTERAKLNAQQERLAVDEAAKEAGGDYYGATATRQERQALLKRAETRRILNPIETQALDDHSRNTKWEMVATNNPYAVMQLIASGNLRDMDPAKSQHYFNVAVNVLNQRQAALDRADKEAERAIKRTQEVTAAQATADVIEGKPVAIAPLVRSRALDDAVGRTLQELQRKLVSSQDPAKYQKGLAASMEASLEQQKYDNKPLDPRLAETIMDDYYRDRITKDEFTHLMSVVRGVDDYKHQAGKEDTNNDISHAHAKLEQSLRTTGPADKFDALSNQTIVDATEYFYRRMKQQPTADPWKIKKEAEDIFKPVIEKRLGLSKEDKAKLDDAKMDSMLQSKVITPAGHKAYRDKSQEERGWNAVQDAIKNLPPPPPPGYFERLKKMFEPTQERKQGVMQGE